MSVVPRRLYGVCMGPVGLYGVFMPPITARVQQMGGAGGRAVPGRLGVLALGGVLNPF